MLHLRGRKSGRPCADALFALPLKDAIASALHLHIFMSYGYKPNLKIDVIKKKNKYISINSLYYVYCNTLVISDNDLHNFDDDHYILKCKNSLYHVIALYFNAPEN